MMGASVSPGAVITLGGVHKFRFNHPAEAAVLRERRRVGAAWLKMEIMHLAKMALMVTQIINRRLRRRLHLKFVLEVYSHFLTLVCDLTV